MDDEPRTDGVSIKLASVSRRPRHGVPGVAVAGDEIQSGEEEWLFWRLSILVLDA